MSKIHKRKCYFCDGKIGKKNPYVVVEDEDICKECFDSFAEPCQVCGKYIMQGTIDEELFTIKLFTIKNDRTFRCEECYECYCNSIVNKDVNKNKFATIATRMIKIRRRV